MPLYEYECEACGHRFESIRKFSDAPLTECPKCGGTLRKLMSSPAIQFKGSGWYITDYAKKDSGGGSKTSGTKESSDKSDPAKSDSAKSETSDGSAKSDSSSSASSDSTSKPAAKD